jgi:hypothetical protein
MNTGASVYIAIFLSNSLRKNKLEKEDVENEEEKNKTKKNKNARFCVCLE